MRPNTLRICCHASSESKMNSEVFAWPFPPSLVMSRSGLAARRTRKIAPHGTDYTQALGADISQIHALRYGLPASPRGDANDSQAEVCGADDGDEDLAVMTAPATRHKRPLPDRPLHEAKRAYDCPRYKYVPKRPVRRLFRVPCAVYAFQTTIYAISVRHPCNIRALSNIYGRSTSLLLSFHVPSGVSRPISAFICSSSLAVALPRLHVFAPAYPALGPLLKAASVTY